jgi:uncharacterized protein (DUF433 family)
MEILGRGVYTIPEAATLTRLTVARVREWFRGGPGSRSSAPVFQSDYPSNGNEPSISFLDLIEVFITGRLRGVGMSLKHIRKIYARLEREYGKHPLGTRQLFASEVDKKKIFTRVLDDTESRSVSEAFTNQPDFEQAIGSFLREIDYDEATGLAKRWHIARMVVLDPAVSFGKPTIESVGITTRVLADSYFANDQNAKAVSDWYEIEEDCVRAAVEFEAGLAGVAA